MFDVFLTGWTAELQPASHPAAAFHFDVFISAGGGRFVPDGETNNKTTTHILNHFCCNKGTFCKSMAVTEHTLLSSAQFPLFFFFPKLSGFKHKELRGKLAIGITANFINRNTAAEAQVAEISGVARIYNQKFFHELLTETGMNPHTHDLRSRVQPDGRAHLDFSISANRKRGNGVA